jgi:hypothetical protein
MPPSTMFGLSETVVGTPNSRVSRRKLHHDCGPNRKCRIQRFGLQAL